MNEASFKVEKAPHIHRKDSVNRMLGDVLIALLPVLVWSIVAYQWDAVRNIVISILTMGICELIFVLIINRLPYDGQKHSFKERFLFAIKVYKPHNLLAPTVSGAIFALIMPATMNPSYMIYPALILGSIFGIVIGKLVFGGLGQNIFNPAAVGMVFAKICFGSYIVYPERDFFEVIAGGTPLASLQAPEGTNSLIGKFLSINDMSLLDLFLGQVNGTIGEAFKIAILIGLAYLLIRRAIDWRIVVSYLATFLLLSCLAGAIVCTRVDVNFFEFIGFQLLSGGMLFGVTFMLTDPVTSPISSPGRVMYGIIAASLTLLIRLLGAYPEGMAYSILLSNLLVPFIEYRCWSGQKFTYKKMIACAAIFAIAALAIGLGLGFGGEIVAETGGSR